MFLLRTIEGLLLLLKHIFRNNSANLTQSRYRYMGRIRHTGSYKRIKGIDRSDNYRDTRAATGGINIDVTMPGKWAVNPMGLGSVIIHAGSAHGGQPIFQSVDVGTGCHDDTGGTRIRGQSSTTASGATIGSTNSGIVITAINTAAYD